MFMSIKLCLPPTVFCGRVRVLVRGLTFKVSHSTSKAQTLFVWRKVMDLIQDRLISLCMIFQKCHRNAKKGFFNLMILNEKLVLNPDGSHGLKRNLVILSVSLIRLS